MAGSSELYAFDVAWSLERGAPLAGADEAGRGAFAGPIVAAATVIGENEIENLNDSKAVGRTVRQELFGGVIRNAEAISVVSFPAWWIDRFGLGPANKEALERAVKLLDSRSGCGLADGNLVLKNGIECLPRADTKSAAVAAASIVAKVLRDEAMRYVSLRYEGYGFERNRGYGTPEHRGAIAELGPCKVHRMSYAGVGT